MFTRDSQACITDAQPQLSDIENYDHDTELALHLVFDSEPTQWALDTLGAEEIEWDTDDGVLTSDCDDYQITEDPVYGHVNLLFEGDVFIQDLRSVSLLMMHARAHRHVRRSLFKKV